MAKNTRTSSTAIALFACAALFYAPATAASRAIAAAENVKVSVKYSGKGEVDASHKLWVWLFDTPDLGPGAIPIAEQSLDKNSETAAFSDVTAKTVWIAVAYDEKGGFTGSAPPPSGSPVALYTEAGAPTGVTPGEKAEVTVAFDDSFRMP